MPELSYGSHFFQDLVESEIFYGAVYCGEEGVVFNESFLKEQKNLLTEITGEKYSNVIRIVTYKGLELYSDTDSNKMFCIASG
jgi:pyruvate, water dikinase